MFLHRAGNSAIRGTKPLIEVWLKHPEWPALKIIMDEAHRLDLNGAKNIEYIIPPKLDADFQCLMAKSAFHIHPTQTEGYGLAISEGLGYGCIVLATDAPPMNELVSAQNGGLLPVQGAGKQCLSELFFVSLDGIEQEVEALLSMSDEDIATKSRSATIWFDKNETEFQVNINHAINELTS